jgi:hypothetical protein
MSFSVVYGDAVALDVYNPKSYFLWCKREEWRGEEEVRVVVIRGEQETVRFDPRLLTRIILGKNNTSEHEAQVRGWAKGTRAGTRHSESALGCA